MTRRDLIQKVLLGGATLMVVPSVLESCAKQDSGIPLGGTDKLTLDLTNATYSALNSAGGSVVVSGIIIANTGSNVFVALDSACTHAGCTISYNNSNKNFPCPCHGSIFSTSGSVLNGPAATALKTHNVTKSGDVLIVSL
jgi:cytochrome b6-f complex iron-sulfur subunit